MGLSPMDFRTTSTAAPIVNERSRKYFLAEKIFFVEVVRIGRFVTLRHWQTAIDVVSFAQGRTNLVISGIFHSRGKPFRPI